MPKTNHSVSYLQRRRWSLSDARAALAALDSSGLSIAEFARRHGLEAHRLYRWQDRLAGSGHTRTTESAPALIEIQPRRADPVEIVLSSGRILRVSETIDPAALARLIGVLERIDEC